ncbi:hypothetical protein DS2_05270 [Catenovulum agarivorans DS-2]|uniref:Lipoprotein n=1 Tax=Catenovulum agarivorans DS-2 TaxID=1328313 RepID=W7QHA5_9ALTE|nr:hypothetical protein [Catenovulum agarivorans]EWH11241.1 hypothetical protein DS2_05270 [Catenovulum agarivorans DS-2]
MLKMKFKCKWLWPVLLSLSATACSYQQAYQGMQQAGKQQNCRDIIDEAERAKCEKQFDKDYKTYKKQRQAVMQREQ